MSSAGASASRFAKLKQLAPLLTATAALLALLLVVVTSPTVTEAAPPTINPSGSESAPDKGVIKPPPTGDAAIQTTVPNPKAGSNKDVIPPPGTPGGNPNIEPR